MLDHVLQVDVVTWHQDVIQLPPCPSAQNHSLENSTKIINLFII